MEINEEVICCPVIGKNFVTARFSFQYEKDKELVDSFVKEGLELASKFDGTLARDSSRKRNRDTVKVNAIAGIISEFVWREWLTSYASKNKISLSVNKTALIDIGNQIDIEIVYDNREKKSLEVRSSFPYTGIQNGICRVFDILGWYTNQVKKVEIKKDYYGRCLFPYNIKDFWKLLHSKFDAYLAGGATRQMLETSPHAQDKELVPFDERDEIALGGKKTIYRVIVPIVNGDDIIQISNKIINGE